MSNYKFQIGDKVQLKLDAYDKAFRPKLTDGVIGEIVEEDSFNFNNEDSDSNLYYVKVDGDTYAVFENQLEKSDN